MKIVSPGAGSTFTVGSTVPIMARVTNPNAVKSVDFYVDGVRIGKTDTIAQ